MEPHKVVSREQWVEARKAESRVRRLDEYPADGGAHSCLSRSQRRVN